MSLLARTAFRTRALLRDAPDALLDAPLPPPATRGARHGKPPAPAGGTGGGEDEPDRQRFRTIWISDIHLGTRACQADLLLDFLRRTESQTLYLVGDIVDGWRLKRSWYWPQSHNDVVQKVLRKARKGTEVVYVPGNHDEMLRDYLDHEFGGVAVRGEVIHQMADGRRFLVLHGDVFDGVLRYAQWLAHLGDHAYTVCLAINRWFNWCRRKLGLSYWSLSAVLKHKVKNAVQYVGNYEQVLADEARRRGVDGIICGHIHSAEIRMIEGVLYCNDGDWVESCTALVEHLDGRLEILRWADLVAAERARERRLALAG
ncbi:UDP-2,3-diacylglucosamine diphosphatase [Zavarzinia sp. CC-PAN008]|uniref:UDP-2,3-diacylglucosamine diphosphatase n=1 Tax=Zavarzinia sp. CC-PAN008 TaxID=3243332 RepID=UPI003F748981